MPRLNGYDLAVDESGKQVCHKLFVAVEAYKFWKYSPIFPTKLPIHLIFVEILASTCGWYFLQRRIHMEGLPALPASVELVLSHKQNSACMAAC
jgi:hypothetical protein